MKSRDIEIMAPVGSYESLMAAIQAGAGSVYFGVEKLNMRSRSSFNFTLEDLKEIVRRCEASNVKTYLTVNTVIFDEEFTKIKEIIVTAKEAGVSAIIAADMGVIQLCRDLNMEVHISTQVNITNYEAVKFYANFADVVVLAREVSMDRVKYIHDRIIEEDLRGPNGDLIRIEMFVHGALCMAVSGKCYLSLHERQSSANRGACSQVCRRSYIVTDKQTGEELEIDNEYIMSPKDLKTIHFLNKVLDSGVTVLKVEGRARSAEYVDTAVTCYKEAIEAYCNNEFTEEKIASWDARLSEVFNRGFWDGYYLGQRLGEWSHKYGSKATKKKVIAGKTTNYFAKLKVGEFLLQSGTLEVGDEILITGPTTGVVKTTVKELRFDLQPVEKVEKGQLFSMPIDVKVRRQDKLYKIVEASKVNDGQ
ncbi:U32 family peptidase [Halosquirtibacter laminarini]|uniref:U32 family peptidase n=1 Tax=Halosquirtibacter laminarini TaxID=3374600 RepID=A0AC61NDZ6_9BACT|nr:U32 family peptidase [Prolixibacteraceae bacterium]